MTDSDILKSFSASNPAYMLNGMFPLDEGGEIIRRCRAMDRGFTNEGWCPKNRDTLQQVLQTYDHTPSPPPTAYEDLKGVYAELRNTAGTIDAGAVCQMLAPILKKLSPEENPNA